MVVSSAANVWDSTHRSEAKARKHPPGGAGLLLAHGGGRRRNCPVLLHHPLFVSVARLAEEAAERRVGRRRHTTGCMAGRQAGRRTMSPDAQQRWRLPCAPCHPILHACAWRVRLALLGWPSRLRTRSGRQQQAVGAAVVHLLHQRTHDVLQRKQQWAEAALGRLRGPQRPSMAGLGPGIGYIMPHAPCLMPHATAKGLPATS